MRCFGLTKNFKRCKNKCKTIYCRTHKFQWLISGLPLIGLLAGLYSDIIDPFVPHKDKEKEELITLMKLRKQDIDSCFIDFSSELDKSIINDSSQSAKDYKLAFKRRLNVLKEEYDTTANLLLSSLDKGDLIIYNELHTKIHKIGEKVSREVDSMAHYIPWESKTLELGGTLNRSIAGNLTVRYCIHIDSTFIDSVLQVDTNYIPCYEGFRRIDSAMLEHFETPFNGIKRTVLVTNSIL